MSRNPKQNSEFPSKTDESVFEAPRSKVT